MNLDPRYSLANRTKFTSLGVRRVIWISSLISGLLYSTAVADRYQDATTDGERDAQLVRHDEVPVRVDHEQRRLLTGMFAYMADAAIITLCVNGPQMPVAMEGDYPALESAYLATRTPAGQPLLVLLEARLAKRPSMEEGSPAQTTLVVDCFIAIYPDRSGKAPCEYSRGEISKESPPTCGPKS